MPQSGFVGFFDPHCAQAPSQFSGTQDNGNGFWLEKSGQEHPAVHVLNDLSKGVPRGALFGELFGIEEKQGVERSQMPRGAFSDPVGWLKARYKEKKHTFLKGVRGFFALALMDTVEGELLLACDPTGVLPMFYQVKDGRVVFATSVGAILQRNENKVGFSRSGLLEMIFLNYPIAENTLFQGIKRVPPGTIIQFGKNLKERKTVFFDLFENMSRWAPKRGTNPGKVEELSFALAEIMREYTDGEGQSFAMTLTGGFDSRVLLAALPSDRLKKMEAVTFGIQGNIEMTVARRIRDKLEFRYTEMVLDEEYEKGLLALANRAISLSGGVCNFRRAHYLYFAERIAERNQFLITGTTGSTLLRDGGFPSSLVSPFFQRIIRSPDPSGEIVREVDAAFDATHPLNLGYFNLHRDEIIDRLKNSLSWAWGGSEMDNYLKTKIRCLIPSYFGPEISLEYQFFPVRIPFLDLKYLQLVAETGHTVFSRNVFRETKLDKLRSHALYSRLIVSHSKLLGSLNTDRGYPPAYSMHSANIPIIVALYGINKLKRRVFMKDRFFSDLNYPKWCAFAVDELARNSAKLPGFWRVQDQVGRIPARGGELMIDKLLTLTLLEDRYGELRSA